MRKVDLEKMLSERQQAYKSWEGRYLASAWNDDGKGGHIPSEKMMGKYLAQIELLNELISKATF